MKIKLLLSSLLIATSMNAQTNVNETEPELDESKATYFYYDDEIHVNSIGYTKRNLLEEKVYIMENNEIYFQEFIDFVGLVKGTINKETGIITIKNGQAMGTKQLTEGGTAHQMYFATMNPTTQQPETGEFTLKYIDKGDGKICIDGGSLCFALYYMEQEKPIVFLHTKGLKMINEEQIDDKIQKTSYNYVDLDEEEEGNGVLESVKYGENIYFKSLETIIPEKWQVAKVINDNNKMSLFIPNNQFLSYLENIYFVFKAAKIDDSGKITELEGLTLPMTLDASTHTYKCTTAKNDFLGSLSYTITNSGVKNEWVTKYGNISIMLPETQVTNGITTVIQPKTQENNQYYDLQGRAIQHPTRGIYIKNGKKIVIK